MYCRAGAAASVPAATFVSSILVTELDDVYPLPNMLDFAAKAAACTIFSKIDLRKGYHQILVNPEILQKTATTSPSTQILPRAHGPGGTSTCFFGGLRGPVERQ